MSRADWELIEIARARALADRYESEALTAATEAGQTTLTGQQAYALAWLAHRCADRIVRLENARPVHGAQRPAARTPTGAPTSDQRRGAPPLHAVPAPPDGLGISERTLMFGSRKSRK